MAIRQYIGARYVPKFDGDWDNTKVYEPLTIVTYSNSSYTSKSEVPAGVVPTNTTYWAETGNYNGQIANLDNEIRELIYINVLCPPSGCPTLDNTNTLDNTSALQQIINYVYALGTIGACIFFPRGTYRFDGTVDVNTPHIRFLGEENGATRFECRTTTTGGQDMFYVHRNFIKFENIAFWVMGDNTYENTFIHGDNARRIMIDHCMLYDAKYALKFEDCPAVRCYDATVAFNVISYTSPIGWHFSGTCNSSYITNCVASMKVGSAIGLLLDGKPQDINISGFETAKGLYGIEITADAGQTVHDLQIHDIVIDEPSSFGVFIHDLTDDSEVSISRGFISPLSNSGRGVRLYNCKNVIIEGLKITNNHNLTNVDGFSLGGIVENVKIKGCYLYDMIRAIICIPNSPNAYKNISFDENLIVNTNHTGGTVSIYTCESGSVNSNSFRGNITQAMIIGNDCGNSVIVTGNNGLTNSACTNNYVGAYQPTGFEPTLTNVFTVD